MYKLLSLLGGAALCALAAIPANAMLVTSLGALSANDSIDWGQLGPDSTVYPGGFVVVVSGGGVFASVINYLSPLERLDQGTGWTGNFTPGDHLLYNTGAGPDITISFTTPVSGVGAQIQGNEYGNFSSRISLTTLYGPTETYTEDGVSNGNADGSAIFLGALHNIRDITGLSFRLDSPANDFAIDTLYLNTTGTIPKPPSVPEPATLALFGAGLAGLGALRRRRKAKS